MTTISAKKITGLSLLAIAGAFALQSCGDDTHSSTGEKVTSGTDSTAVLPADTVAVVSKSPKGPRKGKASANWQTDKAAKMEKGKDGVYSRAEQMPEYPGGEKSLTNFVENNISYPQEAIDQNTEGTVNVSFVVDEKGHVQHPVSVGNAAGHGLDQEAINMVKKMPVWKPGIVKGKPVKTRLSLPVTFRLSDS